MTPIGLRLLNSLNDEYLRMLNEWFFKWHTRSHEVEIDSFLGKPIFYGGIGIKFDGSARLVYWDTIQRYLRKKIGSIFDSLEEELSKYPPKIRAQALTEARWIVRQFAAKIRRAAIEKDRILRGNGIEFPPEHDAGHWEGCDTGDIEGRVEGLRQIYCDLEQDVPTATAKLSDAVILKPTFFGMGIDLQKAWSWVYDKWRAARCARRRCGMMSTRTWIIGFTMALACSQASADDLIGIRCVGYEVPIPRPLNMARREGEAQLFYAPQDTKFDVYISPSRGIGWWESSAAIKTDEEHPAKLVKMDITTYRLEATKVHPVRDQPPDRWTEWVVLDRTAGTIDHSGRHEPYQIDQIKRGGKCSKLEPKF